MFLGGFRDGILATRSRASWANGGVDRATARIKAPFAGLSKLREALPPLASNDLLCVAHDRKNEFRFCARIGLPIHTVLSRGFLLQKSVAARKLRI